jgi:hypothetical protein
MNYRQLPGLLLILIGISTLDIPIASKVILCTGIFVFNLLGD